MAFASLVPPQDFFDQVMAELEMGLIKRRTPPPARSVPASSPSARSPLSASSSSSSRPARSSPVRRPLTLSLVSSSSPVAKKQSGGALDQKHGSTVFAPSGQSWEDSSVDFPAAPVRSPASASASAASSSPSPPSLSASSSSSSSSSSADQIEWFFPVIDYRDRAPNDRMVNPAAIKVGMTWRQVFPTKIVPMHHRQQATSAAAAAQAAPPVRPSASSASPAYVSEEDEERELVKGAFDL